MHDAPHNLVVVEVVCIIRRAPAVVGALFFGRPFIKRFALCWRTVVCPVCLSVTLVYCGQTVGWINMSLGREVGLGSGHIVLDADSTPSMERGTAALHFSAMSVAAKRLYGAGYHLVWRQASAPPRRYCVTWGPSSPTERVKATHAPHFSAREYCGQTVAHLSSC